MTVGNRGRIKLVNGFANKGKESKMKNLDFDILSPTETTAIDDDDDDECDDNNDDGVMYQYSENLKIIGYSIIILTWVFFVISIGTILNVWQWCFKIRPGYIQQLQEIPILRVIVNKIIEQNQVLDNYYMFAIILNFVILWIWAVASWISMKLFRHSKGGGS